MRKMVDVTFGSSRYDDLVELRYKVLLEPLGLKFLDSFRNKEASYLHIGCIEQLDDKLVTEYINRGEGYENIRKIYSVNIVYFALGSGSDTVLP